MGDTQPQPPHRQQQQQQQQQQRQQQVDASGQLQLSDFVGEHGPYQLSLTLFLFIRYVFLGLMANSGSLMTPDVTFYCQLPMDEVVAIMPNISLLNETERELEIKEEFKRICQIDLHLYQQAYLNSTLANQQQKQQQQPLPRRSLNASAKIRECTDFTYDIALDQGRTMTSEFDLVCDRDWLRSLFQSLISAAIVVAHVFWGTFSDKYGRYRAQKLCLLVSLVAGASSIVAGDFWTFTVMRALCSFGDLGLVVSLTTTVVELVGNQYRGLSVALVNFGYALGVTIFPYFVAYFEDFRKIIIVTVLCHLFTIPFILTSNESIRWLLTNRRFKLAKRELRRIVRINRHMKDCWRWLAPATCWRRCCGPRETAGTGDDGPPPDELESGELDGTSAKASTKSRFRQKLEFDLMFNRFIDQIEAQNFCDPLNSSSRCETSSSAQHEEISFSDSECRPLEPQPPPPPPPTQHQNSTNQHLQTIVTEPTPVVPQAPPGEELANGASVLSQQRAKLARGLSSSACRLNILTHQPLNEPHSPQLSNSSCQDRTSLLSANLRAGSCGRLDELVARHQKEQQQEQQRRQRRQTENLLPGMSQPRASFLVRHPGCQPDCINLVAHQLSFVGRVSRLFKDKQLMIAVFTIVWTTFNSELQYTSFIIINLEVGEDVYLNYILGGCMEALAAITASILLSYAPRRHTLITFWLLISASCFGLSIAHIDSTWAVWLLALAKFSQSCLSSVASVAAYESFPTFLRQSGSGLVFTLGMLGSVFAPLIFAEFDDHDGMDRVLMTFSLSSLTAAILIYLYLKETRNCELQ